MCYMTVQSENWESSPSIEMLVLRHFLETKRIDITRTAVELTVFIFKENLEQLNQL